MISPIAASYAGRVNEYVSGRPGYPPELLCDLPLADTIVELGAGTGKFTGLLASTGKRILAVEPIEEMASRIRVDRPPGVEVLSGSAEAIPVPDDVAGLVCCASAFHWFDYERATCEILRVLYKNGALALIWNMRDERVPWVSAFCKLIDSYGGHSPRQSSAEWRIIFRDSRFKHLATKTYPLAHSMPPRAIVDRALSHSFIAALNPREQEIVRNRVVELIESDPALAGKVVIQFPYMTKLHLFRKER